MTLAERKALIGTIADEATLWRRELHQHPQTMYEETYASGLVQRHLDEWGIPYEAGFAGTGVVATVAGQAAAHGRSIAFRADIDALDIAEETGLPWASVYHGKMHACGHDGHTAIVLALAKYLQQTRNFAGLVRLIFQPAEEGGRGADRMVQDGLLERLPFDEVYGLHNMPYGPLGHFSICAGNMMAATDFFEIALEGRGGHAAMPHGCDDLVLAGSQLVSAFQGLVSREVSAQDAAVLSVTNFESGTGANNVLPTRAKLSGTVRTFTAATRNQMEARMGAMIEHIAAAFRVKPTFTYRRITDAVVNDPASVEHCRASVLRAFGEASLHPQEPVMGGEDFGSFLEQRPGAFIFAGQAMPDPASPHSQGLHTPGYDFNDALIPLAVEYFAELAETRLA
jgi:hippurate hydrolase